MNDDKYKLNENSTQIFYYAYAMRERERKE